MAALNFRERPKGARLTFKKVPHDRPFTLDEQLIENAKPGPMEWPKSAQVGCAHEWLIVQDRERYGKKETERQCLVCGAHLQRSVGMKWNDRYDKERPRIRRHLPAACDAALVDAGVQKFWAA